MKDRSHHPSWTPALNTRVAATRSELAGAFELAYRCYLEKDFIRPHPGRIVYRTVFGRSCSRTIITTSRAQGVIGTLTVVGDNPLGLGLEKTFPSEVQSLRDQGRRECEITCLAIESAGKSPPRAAFFSLTKFMLHYANQRQYDDLLMAIHPRHYRFYRHHYRAHLEGSPRPHSCVEGNLAVCCRIDLHQLEQNMPSEIRQYYFSQVLPETQYLGPPMDPADHRCLCVRSGISPLADSDDCSTWKSDAA